MDSYSTPGLVLFILLSGFISFVIAKSIQYLKGKGADINLGEFAFIFTISMVLTTIFIFLGFPLIGFLVSGGVGLYIVPFLSYLSPDLEVKVTLGIGDSNFMDGEGKS